jgi:hypothetical protein
MRKDRPLADVPDAELVRRATAGERDAFEEIYARHHAVVYRFARPMSGAALIAEEVTRTCPSRRGNRHDCRGARPLHYSLDRERKIAIRMPLPFIVFFVPLVADRPDGFRGRSSEKVWPRAGRGYITTPSKISWRRP